MAAPTLNEPKRQLKTTERGLLTEMRVQLRLIEMGASLLVPIGHDHPFDLVVYRSNSFCRIQIKTARDGHDNQRRRNGTMIVPASSVVDRAGGKKFTKILTSDDCDAIVAYYDKLGKFYLLRPGLASFVLRYGVPKSTGGSSKIREADDYELRSLDQLFACYPPDSRGRALGTDLAPNSPLMQNLPLFQEVA